MTKKKFVGRVAEVLRQNDVRKSVPTQKMILHVRDDEGNENDFTIRKPGRGVLYNANDIEAIVDACLAVMEDCLKHGEEISVYGFGSLGLQYRAPKTTKIPYTGEWVDLKAHFIPKFTVGKNLKLAAKVFEMSLDGENALRAAGQRAETGPVEDPDDEGGET